MLLTRLPRPPLVAKFVATYWYCELESNHDLEIIFPSAEGQIIFGLHSSSPQLNVLVGPASRPSMVDANHQRRAVGVSLRVGATAFLCGENAVNLVNQEVDTDAIWGSGADSFADRLRNISEPKLLFDQLDAALHYRLKNVRPVDPDVVAAEEALRLGTAAGEIPTLLQADRRRLARSFSETVGLGLKSYSRLCRFNAAVSELRRPSSDPLSMLAASLGYADQAHFSREVKEFSGVTPGLLRSQPSSSPNHLVLPTSEP